jgi:hypothetical protein
MDQKMTDKTKYLRERNTFLRRMIKENGGEEEVCNIIAKDIDAGLSNSQVTYFERLLSELDAVNHIHVVLVYLNFNSRKYFNHWIDHLSRKMSVDESNAEKLERLLLEQKMINQLPCEFNIGYTDKYPPLKQMITDWIAEEIHFLERSHHLISALGSTEKSIEKEDFKLELDISISQFAFLIKALMAIGVIRNKNISELSRFFFRFVRTKRSENISAEGFRLKYYNVESATKDVVKNTLHNAIGYINRS